MDMFDYLEYCWWYTRLVIRGRWNRIFHKHDWVGVIEIPTGKIGMMHIPESHLVAICVGCGDWDVFCEGDYPTSTSPEAWAGTQPSASEAPETSPVAAVESKPAPLPLSKPQE